jgi:hypothetical protein
LIAHGAHPKYIEAQLGHASIQTTATVISCLNCTRRRRKSWISWCLVRGPRHPRVSSARCASGARGVGAKWELSYRRRTEKVYVHWIKRYIFFHGKRHTAEMGAAEVTAFLTSLAVQGKVAAST